MGLIDEMEMPELPGVDRRRFLMLSAALGITVSAASPLWAATEIPLAWLNLSGPPDKYYQKIRQAFVVPADIENIVKRLWGLYMNGGDVKYGHWALMYNYLWWMSLPSKGPERIRTSQIGQKMGDNIAKALPKSAAGPYWGAVYFGLEALVRGVLNSLQMVPEFMKRLREAERRDPTYNWGSVYMAMAKAYIKLPAFPMSVGSLSKGLDYLKKAEKYQKNTYAYWYIVRAEALIQKSGKDVALASLDDIEKNVCPVDMQTRFTYEMSMYLADRFRAAVAKGTYNRYTWDPLLEPILALRKHEYFPPHMCSAPPGAGGY